MVSKKVTITTASGLHARPAGILCKKANECKCDVKIIVADRELEAKSILNIMVAAIKCGTEIEVRCDGEDEQQSLDTLIDLIENGLGE